MYLYTENPLKFAFSCEEEDYPSPLTDKPLFGILGVPFDSTTTYQPGARYGPLMVREASYNFEGYNLFLDKELTTSFWDIGNLESVPGNFQKTCSNLESVIRSILDDEITPIIIGGEHSISYGVLKAYDDLQDVTILHFDAHMDLRDDYMGEKFSHATVMHRIHDLEPRQIIQMGIRSASPEERQFAQDKGINYYTPHEIKENREKMEKIISQIEGPIYVTVDVDVLDPAYAPSVGTPTPGGLTPHDLEKLIFSLEGQEVVGLDLVEVSANCLGDSTSINAAKTILDFLFLQ
ncbi:MAG: agmatinase [Methanobacterium sp.]|uniref:agmatinase n=1 Tax=Methanobacterium sp. TaxID=2164 RepID=UPI0003C97F1F|nr:agmatinase [Methanobacterium sp.]MDI3550259.1 agmatinase [Methanobacterium sp.]CDG64460.1 putative 32,2 kDa protein in hmfB 3'region [Methanobacterium sp. MB1]